MIAPSASGPPEAKPPDGHGFLGALEDSLARTATAEGHNEEQSGEGTASLSGAAEAPAGDAAQTAGTTDSEGQVAVEAPRASEEGKAHGHGKHASVSQTDATSQPASTQSGSIATNSPLTSTNPGDEAEEAATAAAGNAAATVGNTASQTAITNGHTIVGLHAASAASDRVSSTSEGEQQSADTGSTPVSASETGRPEAPAATADDPATGANFSSQPTSGAQPREEIAALTGTAGAVAGGDPSTASEASSGTNEDSSAATGVRQHLPWLRGSTSSAGTQAGEGTAAATRTTVASSALASDATDRSTVASVPSTAATATPGANAPSAHTAIGKLDAASQSTANAATITSSAQANAGSSSGDAQPLGSGAATLDSAGATTSPAADSTPWSYGVNVQQTIETIHATVALASRQGAASAQIQLEPAELGAVKIHLTQTSEGLVARVSAETAAGAQAIASGQGELHQTLSSLGISLLRLDVDGSSAGWEGQAQGNASQGSRQQTGRLREVGEEADEAASVTSTTAVSLSSNSALIDVLA